MKNQIFKKQFFTKKRIIIFSAIFATLCVCIAVTAVVLIKNRPLDAPINLCIEDDYLKWNAVSDAKGYMVDINTNFMKLRTTPLTFLK